MRVIHLSCVAPPDIGGIGRVAAKEVALLKEHDIDAHHVSLTTHAGFRFGNAGSVHALDHFVRDADIVHLHYPFYGTAGAVARLKRNGTIKRLVITLHMDATAGGPKGAIFELHRKLFQDKTLSVADMLIVSSRDYARHSSYRRVAERAVELPFGVDEKLFSPGRGNRARFNLSEDKPVVLFVGGMDKAHDFKGIDILLAAIARLKDVQLLLIGEGGMRKEYASRADTLGIGGRSMFAGKLAEANLVTAYRSADVLALPSTSAAEAFGLVAVEAQSCGIPVVASDLPGVRTVVADHETGILVPPKDEAALAQALLRLTSDRATAERMSRQARERVLERFTWSAHMVKLEELYASLV
jgi:glycosyltransferase involved in cell wall biosynthesis